MTKSSQKKIIRTTLTFFSLIFFGLLSIRQVEAYSLCVPAWMACPKGNVCPAACGETSDAGFCSRDTATPTSECTSGIWCNCWEWCCSLCLPGQCGTEPPPPPPPPPPPSQGAIIGRIWTDFDGSGAISNGYNELWANTASTCAIQKHDGFNITHSGVNILSSWACNGGGSYYATAAINSGLRSVTLVGLPAGYECSRVEWSYSTYTNSTAVWSNTASGTGCVTSNITILDGAIGSNHLSWKLTPTPKYGSVVGKIRTDYNKNGNYDEVSDGWGNTASACAGLKHDGFSLTEGAGANLITTWGCDAHPSPSYYSSSASALQTGTRTLTLGGLPPGYVCNNTNVVWGYSSTTGSTNGTGCTATVNINEGGVNSLWWILIKPNTTPTVTVSPSTITYTAAGEVYPVRVGITDPDPYGTIKIPSTLTAGLGNTRQTSAIEFLAYGNQSSGGQWPIVRIYGWRKDTGARVAIQDAWRAGNPTDILIDSATPKLFYIGLPWGDINTYSHFDFEFTNDLWDPVTRTGTDVFVNSLRFYQDDPMWDWYPYVVEAEDASWVQFDRGDPDDGNDVIKTGDTVSYGPWVPIVNGADSYAGMYWGGALRFPVLWVSPNAGVTGSLTFNVSDEYGVNVSRSVAINYTSRTLSGRVWTIPSGTTINNAYCAANHTSGGAGTLSSGTVTAEYTGRTASINSSGLYSFANFFGYVSGLSLSGIVTPPIYRIACVNDIAVTSTGLTTFDIAHTSPSNQTINIGLRTVNAGKWAAAMGSDIYANNIAMALPPVSCPSGATYMCPSFTQTPSYFILGYGANSSSIFTGEPISVGPSRLSESNISATNANTGGGADYRRKNKQYSSSTIKALVTELSDKALATGTAKTSVPTSYTTNSVTVLNKSVGSIPDPTTYTIPSGLAFLIVPKNGNTPFLINDLLVGGSGRLVIIADRDIEIGSLVQGTTGDPKTTTPNIRATIITSGNITIKNTALASPATVLWGGAVISGGNITLERDLTPVNNEVRPSFFVRYDPLYITELNKIGRTNAIPSLSPLFVFDFAEEGN